MGDRGRGAREMAASWGGGGWGRLCGVGRCRPKCAPQSANEAGTKRGFGRFGGVEMGIIQAPNQYYERSIILRRHNYVMRNKLHWN